MKPLLLIHQIRGRLSPIFRSQMGYIQLLLWGAKVGPGFFLRGRLRVVNYGNLSLGAYVRINSGDGNFVGIDRRISFWVGPSATIEIGDGCALSNSTFVSLSGIRLLPRTFVGGGCEFYDSDFHSLDPVQRAGRDQNVASAPITIGPDAFVGAGSMVLKGVTIGEGAIVGAGSLVTKDIPPHEVWGGRPARRIRELKPSPVKDV